MRFDYFLDSRRAWGLICAIFAAQIVGAFIVAKLFRLDFAEVYIPLALLAAGAVTSLAFRFCSDSRRLGSWQWWVPAILYALFIFSLSNRSYPDATPCFDTKIFHPIEYAVLGVFLCLAWFSISGKKGMSSLAVRVFSVGLLYAASDELHQAFIPGRTPRVLDVVFWDFMGLMLGCGIFLFIRFLLRNPSKEPV